MKWVVLTIMLIPLFKWLAYLERGYRAYGEELCVIGFVILLYSVVHSEPWQKFMRKMRKKKATTCWRRLRKDFNRAPQKSDSDFWGKTNRKGAGGSFGAFGKNGA